MGARYYDPQLGRFISADPTTSDGINRYMYARNNPVGFVDPTGFGAKFHFDGQSSLSSFSMVLGTIRDPAKDAFIARLASENASAASAGARHQAYMHAWQQQQFALEYAQWSTPRKAMYHVMGFGVGVLASTGNSYVQASAPVAAEAMGTSPGAVPWGIAAGSVAQSFAPGDGYSGSYSTKDVLGKSFNFLSPKDPLYEFDSKIEAPPGITYVIAHGSEGLENGMMFQSEAFGPRFSAADMATKMINEGYEGGAVVCIVCYAGAAKGGGAQQLANALGSAFPGVTVTAATGPVYSGRSNPPFWIRPTRDGSAWKQFGPQ
jgi:hypothetical protein